MLNPEPRGLMTRLATGSLMFLVAVIAISIALDLLAKIWIWLLILVVVGITGAIVTWVLRRRANRW
jgi:hypothetical protein